MSNAAINYKTKQEARQVQERKQDVVDAEIERLYKKLGHVPTQKELVEAATKKTNPLNKYFEWDDSIAAQRWRETQAHQMLMSCKYVVELRENNQKRNVQVRKFVVVKQREPMKIRNEALNVEDERQAIIAKATTELRSWCKRFADIEELSEARRAITDVIGTV